MNTLPDWAIAEIKSRIVEETSWRKVRTVLAKRLGWMPSAEQMYDVLHDITSSQKIAPCGKDKKFHNFPRGYVFCGSFGDCPCSVVDAKKTRAATNLERHGAENFFKTPDFDHKRRDTCMGRYGTEFYLQSQDCREKTSETLQKQYGVDRIGSVPEIREQVKKTMLGRYGVEYAMQAPELREKHKTAMKDLYGFDTALENPIFLAKAQEKWLKNFGERSPLASLEIREKIRLSNIDRYGVDHISQRHIKKNALEILNDPRLLKEAMTKNSFHSLALELGVDSSTIGNYWRRHGFIAPLSSYETEIATFLQKLDVSFVMNKKHAVAGVSLDFYLPDFDLAIEFNGLYWHSTALRPDPLYHRKKYEACRDAGIRLLMISEDEWLYNCEAIKQRIVNVLGRSERGVGARKLMIRDISNARANAFAQQYHIQGRTGTISYAVGAFHDDELVSVMAFNQQRGTHAIELVRFCSNGRIYQGAFSRMLKYAILEKNYNEIISFADLRYSRGDVYYKNGFTLVAETKPDYRYVKSNRTYHKSSFTKSKISKKFGFDMSTMTEREAMEKLGYSRIYDCGKLKFIWK